MAAGKVEDAGALVACPLCGTQVRLKATIPYLKDDGAPAFACVACARSFVAAAAPADAGGAPAGGVPAP
jgi:hypothetical protein